MEAFNSTTYTVRQLLKNELDENDRGKNYFIPPYQRPYDWGKDEVVKLINDIYEKQIERDNGGFNPYFIGGIVLSKESILGEERSKKSLEVIDGQQRLTTVVLLLACIVQLLKFQEREFIDREDAVNHLIADISELLKIKSLNLDTMEVEEKHILERSDGLELDYKTALNHLLDEKIDNAEKLAEKLHNTDEAKKLTKLIMVILSTIERFDDLELIDFTIQLLNNTWLVVTKTISFDTGVFIFEKLNDSGKLLEPQDLLKNYIFRTSSAEEYDELTEKWRLFLNEVKEINPTKAKILPRDFLDNYLTIIGNNVLSRDGKKEKLFDKYKILKGTSFNVSMELLDDLRLIAREYASIKRDRALASYMNTINFKLGYLIVLSFYKKYDHEYLNYKKEILSFTIRLGLVFLMIGQSKNLSILVPVICREIINKDTSIEEALIAINEFVNGLLSKKELMFDEIISSTNVFRKKPLTKLLLKIIEFHLGSDNNDASSLIQIMPPEYHPECSYENIDEDNSIKYSNYIGNLLLDTNIYQNQDFNCFSDRYLNFRAEDRYLVNDLNTIIEIHDTQLEVKDNRFMSSSWGKESIISRSQMLAEVSRFIIINDNLNKDFFN